MRLDKFIQEKYSFPSRTYAENLIKTHSVLVNGKVVTKCSLDVDDSFTIDILDNNNFASQGAYKIEEAFLKFSLDINGKSCADIGCSNGGFTDSLLRHGAESVLAIDVAECALREDILNNPRVTFLKANARELDPTLEKVDFICSDVSFISLSYILGSVYNLLKPDGRAVLLIKPQFELDKSALNKSGIVKNEKLVNKAIELVKGYVALNKFKVLDICPAPVRYENKNREFLIYLSK